MMSSTLPSPFSSSCQEADVLPLAQPGSVAGLAICRVVKARTMPPAPESTVAATMSAAGALSLALVSRLMVSPAGSVTAPGPAAMAGRDDSAPVSSRSPANVQARPAALSTRMILRIRHPQPSGPQAGQACDGAPPAGTGEEFDTDSGNSSQMSPSGRMSPSG